MDSLLELGAGHSRLQAQCDLRSGLGVGHVPAFGFSIGKASAAGGIVVRVDLHGKLFVRNR